MYLLPGFEVIWLHSLLKLRMFSFLRSNKILWMLLIAMRRIALSTPNWQYRIKIESPCLPINWWAFIKHYYESGFLTVGLFLVFWNFPGSCYRSVTIMGCLLCFKLVNLRRAVRTEHWELNLTNNPTRCTILFKYIYLCLFCTCFGHPSAHRPEKFTVCMQHWYLSLWMCGVWSASLIETDQTPPIQSDKYQCCIDTTIFSWWWALGCVKHVQKRHK